MKWSGLIRRSAVCCLVVLLLPLGCGEFGEPDQSPDNTDRTGEILKLVSSRELADNRFEYTLALKLDAIDGDKSSPFFMTDFFNWTIMSGTVSSNWLEFKLQTFDRKVSVIYGGNYSLQSWADLKDSAYYVASQDALGFGLENGRLVKWNDFVQGQFGGTATDPADVVGFTLAGDQLTIYMNFAHVAGSLARPYWFSNRTGWLKEAITILGSHGWASKTISIADGETVTFTYGGDLTVETTWAHIAESAYYAPPPEDGIIIRRQGAAIVPTHY